jgi:hypothetical protein
VSYGRIDGTAAKATVQGVQEIAPALWQKALDQALNVRPGKTQVLVRKSTEQRHQGVHRLRRKISIEESLDLGESALSVPVHA